MEAQKQQLQSSVNNLKTRFTDGKQHLDEELTAYKGRLALATREAEDHLTATREQIPALEAVITAKQEQITVLNETLAAKQRDIVEAERIVSASREEETAVHARIRNLEADELKRVDALAEKQNTQDVLEDIIAKATVRLEALNQEITLTENRLSDLHSDLAVRTKNADGELRDVLLQTREALARLKHIQQQDHDLRSDLASRTLALEKREQVIARKEAQLQDAEAKVSQYNKYMKL